MMRSAGSTIARPSSGSRFSINSVEPLRSANKAVRIVRSPSTFSTFFASSGTTPAAFAEVASVDNSGEPQSPQNFAAGALLAPHRGQRCTNSAPHSEQYFFSAGFSEVQLAQRTLTPPLVRRLRADQRQPARAGHNPRTKARAILGDLD